VAVGRAHRPQLAGCTTLDRTAGHEYATSNQYSLLPGAITVAFLQSQSLVVCSQRITVPAWGRDTADGEFSDLNFLKAREIPIISWFTHPFPCSLLLHLPCHYLKQSSSSCTPYTSVNYTFKSHGSGVPNLCLPNSQAFSLSLAFSSSPPSSS